MGGAPLVHRRRRHRLLLLLLCDARHPARGGMALRAATEGPRGGERARLRPGDLGEAHVVCLHEHRAGEWRRDREERRGLTSPGRGRGGLICGGLICGGLVGGGLVGGGGKDGGGGRASTRGDAEVEAWHEEQRHGGTHRQGTHGRGGRRLHLHRARRMPSGCPSIVGPVVEAAALGKPGRPVRARRDEQEANRAQRAGPRANWLRPRGGAGSPAHAAAPRRAPRWRLGVAGASARRGAPPVAEGRARAAPVEELAALIPPRDEGKAEAVAAGNGAYQREGARGPAPTLVRMAPSVRAAMGARRVAVAAAAAAVVVVVVVVVRVYRSQRKGIRVPAPRRPSEGPSVWRRA